MALRLRIVSEHATRLGERATKVFSVHGGSIGRATDNEWILPDPERYLSGKHARVDFRAGTYYLVDTSSNGTYVNGAQVPLGKFRDYAMKDGDYIRLGEYELLVSIDASNDFATEDAGAVAYDGGTPSAAVKKSTANDIGADLDLSELLEPSNRLQEELENLARNAYGQPLAPDAQLPQAGEGDAAGVPWHMMTRPLKVDRNAAPAAAPWPAAPAAAAPAAPTPAAQRQQNSMLYDADLDSGLSAFCRGAGIDPRSVTPEARSYALQLAGQLLRETVLGLMDLNQNRSEFRNRFRMPPPASDAPETALAFSRGVEEILIRLMTTSSTRAGSVEAMRESFRDLKAQNTAMLAAMRAALEELLTRFDPKDLEERFERGGKKGVFGTQSKAKYWEFYTELFAGLSQRPPDGFPHLFVEAFSKAYEAKLRALAPPRRGAFGADPDGASDPGFAAGSDR
jgi:type VI secretion system protein